ncbi:hypothetical protein ACWGCW_32010 [Streptomyces sp. NPDC054933]
MTVQYVVVNGPDGEALEQRQAAAIREALTWLRDHPADDSSSKTH